ncbi:Zinc finger protein 559 [Eumeta japonica]|uniref:Zinc finger protein 559 n=1 Tax=Eumeta variegata TaxID=151549 RepID=A0A4C1VW55_EUMVA|nr:Zinc finger protein 559 [Eumeta japonica]
MELENTKNWASQLDVCRCCLATNGIWDLTASYSAYSGVKEVFSDMLQECFGINLSHLTEWNMSRLICTLCASRLRDADTFRKQVSLAEKQFIDYNHKTIINNEENHDFKFEDIKSESNCDDFLFNDSEDEILTLDKYKVTAKTNSRHRSEKLFEVNGKRHKKSKKKKLATRSDDCDSDTPIAKLNSRKREIAVNNVAQLDLQTLKSVKQLSERKKIITTCSIVLKDTNACPFRHYKSWFQCFFCTEEFMEISLLKTHNSSNHRDVESELKKLKRYPRSLQIDISILKCLICSEELKNVQNMKEHLELNHKKIIYNECIADYKVNTSPFVCHICQLEFHVFRSLTTHINEHYANCICDVCGKSFINGKRLKVHKRTHEKGNYPCHECGKILKTKTSKANHMESAHSKRTLKCQICFKTMKHYNDRIKHMSEAHNITHKFKCPICPREYNIKHYLATHLRQTHGHKNKKCQECGMAFITNHGLKKHMLKHTGEKPFTCEICSKSYARNYTLREHMRVHDNDRVLCNK